MFGVHVLVLKAMEMRKTEMTFSYYHLFKEMVYNAGETDIQGITRVETYDDPPITSRCRFCILLNLTVTQWHTKILASNESVLRLIIARNLY